MRSLDEAFAQSPMMAAFEAIARAKRAEEEARQRYRPSPFFRYLGADLRVTTYFHYDLG